MLFRISCSLVGLAVGTGKIYVCMYVYMMLQMDICSL